MFLEPAHVVETQRSAGVSSGLIYATFHDSHHINYCLSPHISPSCQPHSFGPQIRNKHLNAALQDITGCFLHKEWLHQAKPLMRNTLDFYKDSKHILIHKCICSCTYLMQTPHARTSSQLVPSVLVILRGKWYE